MDPYIKKNTAIPANKEKTVVITENDKTLMILEGESEKPTRTRFFVRSLSTASGQMTKLMSRCTLTKTTSSPSPGPM